MRPQQEAFYRDLHQHPELSHQERQTAAKVSQWLRRCRYQVHAGIGGTGVVTATDADGNEVPVAHACGHDMHVTCLLGAAQLLASSPAAMSPCRRPPPGNASP